MEEFHYRIPWRSRDSFPGHHGGTQAGTGLEFRAYAPFLAATDPRRFDLKASLRNPYQQPVMRIYDQRAAIPIYAIADLSASMGFCGESNKYKVLADFSAALAYSAYRTGDPFAFIGCDSEIRYDLVWPLRRHKSRGEEVRTRLSSFIPKGKNSDGFLAASKLLGAKRGLVFLLSDFHFSLDHLEQVLEAMSNHSVIPVVLWDSAESTPPTSGLARLHDPETGFVRSVWLRKSLSEKIGQAFVQHKRNLVDRCLAHGVKPLFVVNRFNAADVTRYFYEASV